MDGNFVPAEPIELLRNGNFSKIPWMTGLNAGEGLLNTGSIFKQKIFLNEVKLSERLILMIQFLK